MHLPSQMSTTCMVSSWLALKNGRKLEPRRVPMPQLEPKAKHRCLHVNQGAELDYSTCRSTRRPS